MPIVLLTAEYPPVPGGVGDYTRWLARTLHTQGEQITVLTGAAPPGTNAPADPADPPCVRGITSWGWRCWQDVRALLATLQPAVLHIQYQTGAYGMHPAINLLPWWVRRLPHPPRLAVTFHDLLEPYLFPKAHWLGARRWLTRRLAADADLVIATNPADSATLRRMLPAHPPPHIASIPIGSNIPRTPPPTFERAAWRAALGVGPDETLLAYFGLFSPARGFDLLLDVLPDLPATRLLLIGGAAAAHDADYARQQRERIQQINQRQPVPSVIQTGHAPARDVSAHLLAADLVVLPFRHGASLRSGSLLAALTHGAAILTTRPAASQQQALAGLHDGEHALLVPPGDPLALAAAIRRCTDDAALRARLQRGAAALAPRFDWQTIAHEHRAVYRQG